MDRQGLSAGIPAMTGAGLADGDLVRRPEDRDAIPGLYLHQSRAVPYGSGDSQRGAGVLATYQPELACACRAHAVVVPEFTGNQITRILIFLDPSHFGLFGLAAECCGQAPEPARPGAAIPRWPRRAQ